MYHRLIFTFLLYFFRFISGTEAVFIIITFSPFPLFLTSCKRMESGTKMTAAYNGEILRLSSDHFITRSTPQCTHVLIRNPHFQILHVLYSTFSEL